jgi:hypothetical protein
MLVWRKSSFSENPDGNCVEIAWHKSTFSQGSNTDCVEVAHLQPYVLVRDSKNTRGPRLDLPFTCWRPFLRALSSWTLPDGSAHEE